jgi:hypothetical protein
MALDVVSFLVFFLWRTGNDVVRDDGCGDHLVEPEYLLTTCGVDADGKRWLLRGRTLFVTG